MHFNKLRLAGFKSFVDQTEISIEPGLTGIVGPNGCGKSNIVEALRWVMGETSAKQMRGGAMDDVIFSGTRTRPARNQAEVGVSLDNFDRTAPAAFNDSPEIEVSRHIERESGSAYRINGRDVRARDVQLLFADLATGAHSTAIVAQGRIGAIINAKPTERRVLLEEAAGITGLHSRRHEAELKLSAAETNLERLDDVTAQMEAQFHGLKRQARQASRYRNLSGHIRNAEATIFHLYYSASETALIEASDHLAEIDTTVTGLTTEMGEATTRQEEASAAMPPLRQAEAEAAAAVHRLNVARENLDAEEERAAATARRATAQLSEIEEDRAREQAQRTEADEELAKLDDEERSLQAQAADEGEKIEAAREVLDEAGAAVAAAQGELDQAREQTAAEQARRDALTEQASRHRARISALDAEREKTEREIAALNESMGAAADPDEAEATVNQARRAAEAARQKAEGCERARLAAQGTEAEYRETLREAREDVARLEAEAAALGAMLADGAEDLWPPVIDAVRVTAGYEDALGAALGDDLNVPSDGAAPHHWKQFPPDEKAAPLPPGVEALSRYVNAPPVLARRLAQIGVVEEADGERLAATLAQGQRLVSRTGGLWRWDGLTVKPGATTAAATRLAQRNRLREVREQLERANQDLDEKRVRFEESQADVARRQAEERAAREAASAADGALGEARDKHAEALRQEAERRTRTASLDETRHRLVNDLDETRRQLAATESEIAELPPAEALRQRIEALVAALNERRESHEQARRELENLLRTAHQRAERLTQIGRERERWSGRAASAERQLSALAVRREQVQAELDQQKDVPQQIAAKREQLLDQIGAAETRRDRTADTLAEAESRLAAADKHLKAAQAALATAREERVRRQGEVEHARARRDDLAARIREEFGAEPQGILAEVGIDEDQELPAVEDVELKLERLKRERENMGPVNLRAEIEAQEIQEKLETLAVERSDLEAAISRLRQGISTLNREARERLLAAFRQVDAHFQELFVRVFGGGRAHLALTESEDPLDAGLEIMASPPGKRLQIMSLLSGGEQALTAISLIFAVFQTSPAPICVLDEVDAPLDDANVERLCALLEDMAANSTTRFLVITHNAITMAHMDRLYGITMPERGVSQLVSVDLSQAEEMRESA